VATHSTSISTASERGSSVNAGENRWFIDTNLTPAQRKEKVIHFWERTKEPAFIEFYKRNKQALHASLGAPDTATVGALDAFELVAHFEPTLTIPQNNRGLQGARLAPSDKISEAYADLPGSQVRQALDKLRKDQTAQGYRYCLLTGSEDAAADTAYMSRVGRLTPTPITETGGNFLCVFCPLAMRTKDAVYGHQLANHLSLRSMCRTCFSNFKTPKFTRQHVMGICNQHPLESRPEPSPTEETRFRDRWFAKAAKPWKSLTIDSTKPKSTRSHHRSGRPEQGGEPSTPRRERTGRSDQGGEPSTPRQEQGTPRKSSGSSGKKKKKSHKKSKPSPSETPRSSRDHRDRRHDDRNRPERRRHDRDAKNRSSHR
jgi:hypothetical protein